MKSMAGIKRLIITLCMILAISSLFCDTEKKIGILIQKEDTATYTETMQGLTTFLSKNNIALGMVIKNAKNDKTLMKTIAREYNNDPAIVVVVVMGSSAVTIVNKVVTKKPVLFGGINHPEGLGVSGDNITGTTYHIMPSSLISLIQQIKPDVKKVGILYEPPEQNAASKIEFIETEKACLRAGVALVWEEVKTAKEIPAKTMALLGKGIEFIIIPTNALLYNNVTLIRSIADNKKIPLVSFSAQGVKRGALICLTSDNVKLGKDLGQILVDVVINGKKPSEIPFKFPDNYRIIINIKTMNELAVSIPFKVLKRAEKY